MPTAFWANTKITNIKSMLLEALEEPFFQRALSAAILASIACGLIGPMVVVKKVSSISGGLSHAAFGGVGIAFFLGLNPSLGAFLFSILCALLMARAYLHHHNSLDTLISIIWSAGMALGILLISLTPGYAPDLSSYLFGSILFVPYDYVFVAATLDVVMIAILSSLFKRFQAIAFDEEFCQVVGVNKDALFTVLLVMIAICVVVLMKVVGAIMLIALLTTPAVIARQWSSNLRSMMIYACGISSVCCVIGLFGSYWLSREFELNAPTGPLIILTCTLFYLASLILRRRVT